VLQTLPKNVADITVLDGIEKAYTQTILNHFNLLKNILCVNHLFRHTIRLTSLTNKANFALKTSHKQSRFEGNLSILQFADPENPPDTEISLVITDLRFFKFLAIIFGIKMYFG